MAIIDLLSRAQNGQFFANAGSAAGLSAADARASISNLAPAIAEKLHTKAAADPDAFDQLLDLLEEGGDGSDLDDVDAMTGAEALSDGAAILKDLYGSLGQAHAELGPLATATGASLEKITALSATSVLAGLAAANVNTLASNTSNEPQASSGGGFFSIIIAALMKGLLQGAARQLAPRRRRRRTSYYYGTRPRRRRRTRRPGLDTIFKEILSGKR
jgi:hypothetical protein